MKKIDLSKVKGILSRKAMPARRIPGQKERQVLTGMVLKEARTKIMADARAMMDGDELKPKKAITGMFLYFFNKHFTFVEPPRSYQKTDREAARLLELYPHQEKMFVTIANLPGETPVLPNSLKTRKDVKTITVADAPALANVIYLDTSVPIDPKNL
jgi:hypothetical protein